MINEQPIGIFDSGIGGINVLHAIRQQLPNESLIYFADTKNCPYGSKSKDEIIALSEIVVEKLLAKNCKLIVVACNTATGAAINHLRQKYDVPFVGIEPATKPAAEHSKTGNICILATEHTFQTEHFQNTKDRHANAVNVHIQPGIGLVEQVENDEIHSERTRELLRNYLSPLIQKNIDGLVLGCTHYPFLKSEIEKILPSNVKIFDPSSAIANQIKKVLKEKLILNEIHDNATYQFATSGDKSKYIQLLSNLLNFEYTIINL